MKIRTRLTLSAAIAFSLSLPASAQSITQEGAIEDEVVATGTLQRDPAMSAFLAGDFVTAEIEFKRNAFCALRAERGFSSGVEAARESSLRTELSAGGNSAAQPVDGQGGAGAGAGINVPTAAPSAGLNFTDRQKDEDAQRRTCNERGFQLYMTGLSQIKLGKNKDAKESLTRAVVLRKSIYDAHFRLGLLEYQDGNIKKAKQQYKKLRKLEARCKRCDYRDDITEQADYLENLLK
jgi:tetratricopeptide (TPR) repeat protein